MRVHRARPAAIGLATATLALAAAGLAVGGGTLGGFNGLDRSASAGDAFQLVSLLATATVGLIVCLRRPANPIGWIFSSLALFTALYLAAGSYAIRAVVLSPGSLPGGEWAAWFRNWADRSSSALVLLAFLLFPTGRLASPRWRLALVLPPLVAVGFAGRALVTGPMDFLGVPNPLGLDWVPGALSAVGTDGTVNALAWPILAVSLVLFGLTGALLFVRFFMGIGRASAANPESGV